MNRLDILNDILSTHRNGLESYYDEALDLIISDIPIDDLPTELSEQELEALYLEAIKEFCN